MSTIYTRYNQHHHVNMPQDSRSIVAALAVMFLIIALAATAYLVDMMYKSYQQNRPTYPGIETMVDAARPKTMQGSMNSPTFINTPLKRQAKI